MFGVILEKLFRELNTTYRKKESLNRMRRCKIIKDIKLGEIKDSI